MVVDNTENILPDHVSCFALHKAKQRNPARFHPESAHFQLQLQQEGHEHIETLLTQHCLPRTLTTHAPIPPSSTRKQLSAGPSPSFPAQYNAGKEDVSFPAEDQPANLCAMLGKEFSSQIPGVQRPLQSASQSVGREAGQRSQSPTMSKFMSLYLWTICSAELRKPSLIANLSTYCDFEIMPANWN